MAGTYNFTIKQGTELNRPIIWKDDEGNEIDVTGMNAKLTAKVRKSDAEPVIEWDDTNNINVGGSDGQITLTCTPEQSRALNFRYAHYDLFIDDTHLLSGQITLKETTVDG